jgi:hypothetical protein
MLPPLKPTIYLRTLGLLTVAAAWYHRYRKSFFCVFGILEILKSGHWRVETTTLLLVLLFVNQRKCRFFWYFTLGQCQGFARVLPGVHLPHPSSVGFENPGFAKPRNAMVCVQKLRGWYNDFRGGSTTILLDKRYCEYPAIFNVTHEWEIYQRIAPHLKTHGKCSIIWP